MWSRCQPSSSSHRSRDPRAVCVPAGARIGLVLLLCSARGRVCPPHRASNDAVAAPWRPQGAGKPELVVGANAPEITRKAKLFNDSGGLGPAAAPAASSTSQAGPARAPAGQGVDLNTRLKQLTHKEPVMLFMKGSPGAEKCGFSRTITSLLSDNGVKYGTACAFLRVPARLRLPAAGSEHSGGGAGVPRHAGAAGHARGSQCAVSEAEAECVWAVRHSRRSIVKTPRKPVSLTRRSRPSGVRRPPRA